MRARATAAAVVVTSVLLFGGCAAGDAPDGDPVPTADRPGPTTPPGPEATPGPGATPSPALPRTVASDLAAPWGIAFLPDGSALVTVRDTGEVLRVRPDARPAVLGVVPDVAHGGEGGLLGVAVSPSFAQDGQVVLYYTTARDNRVQRATLAGDRLVLGPVVVDGIPRARNHDGGRLAFGPDGYLYVATGDAADPSTAQDLDSLGGKILRVTIDGAPAPGNPFPGSPVWSWGHRNVQGLAWAADGRMLASELGQDTWDELNVVEGGANYGWPVVEGVGERDGFVDPVVVWRTDDASPSGIAVLDGAVYVAALRGESLWRVPLVPGGVGEPERLLEGVYGRLRDVAVDPGGNLWLLTTNTTRGTVRPGDDQVVVVDGRALD